MVYLLWGRPCYSLSEVRITWEDLHTSASVSTYPTNSLLRQWFRETQESSQLPWKWQRYIYQEVRMEEADSTASSGNNGASSPITLCTGSQGFLWITEPALRFFNIPLLAHWLPHSHPSAVPSPLCRASQFPSLCLL